MTTLRLSMTAYKQKVGPQLNYRVALNKKPFYRRKDKVVFVVGPTGTGKSRLAIDLATRFQAEVVNCDKMQVYKDLNIVTNKVTEDECRGVPHHLLGIIDSDTDFSSEDFRNHASLLLESIAARNRLPVVAGGSNSYIEALMNDEPNFQMRYQCCFLWIDVSMPTLHSFLSDRVDRMVKAGLIYEVRNMFDPNRNDYSRGIRQAIGVPELDQYFRKEATADAITRERLLDAAIAKIKENTCMLACHQLQKIHRLHRQWNWDMHRIDATEVFLRSGEDAEEAWEELVAGPSTAILNQFLYNTILQSDNTMDVNIMNPAGPIPIPAMAAGYR